MSNDNCMTVADLIEALSDMDPGAKVTLGDTKRDDRCWHLRKVIDDDSGGWVLLEPGAEIPVTVDD